MKQVIIHAGMKYHCLFCHREWWMMLEKGLEEHGPDHKPVPFIISCPYCGGRAQDVSGLVKMKREAPLPKGVNYFSNSKKSDCGKPVCFNLKKPHTEAVAFFKSFPWDLTQINEKDIAAFVAREKEKRKEQNIT